jgi:hypothetical protein
MVSQIPIECRIKNGSSKGNFSNVLRTEKNDVDYVSYSFLPISVNSTIEDKHLILDFNYISSESKDSTPICFQNKKSFPCIVVGKYTNKIIEVKLPINERIDNEVAHVKELITQEEKKQKNQSAKRNYQIVKDFLSIEKIKELACQSS